MIIGGETVVLYTDLGTVSGVTDNNDGTYTFTLTSNTTGTATITGSVNGYWLVDTASIDVTVAVAWAECDYEFRKKITIQASQVTGTSDLLDFPVLINLPTDTELAASARNDGFDISFTSSDGLTQLSHQIERFDGGTGELVAWVKVPVVAWDTDTDIYLYYGNPTAANQEDPDGVWDANYMGVWHLDESGTGALFEYRDSTANANHGTGGKDYGDYVPTIASGQIGFGQTFDGANDFIDTGNSGWYDTNWTHRRRIIIDSDKVSGSTPLSYFPLLIDSTVPDWRDISNGGNVGNADGSDIFFTGDEGGKLHHQIEQYDPTTGHLVAWVEVGGDGVRVTDDTTLYMYYGNSGAPDQQNVASTWDGDCVPCTFPASSPVPFESVYHLHDDFADSSGNQVAGTNNLSIDTTGMAGDGQAFDGSSYIDTNWISNYAASQDFTWSGWFKVTTVNGSDDLLGIEDRLTDLSEIRLSVRDNDSNSAADSFDIWIRPDSGTSYSGSVTPVPIADPNDGDWHYVALQRDGSTGRLFYDGTEIDSAAVSTNALNFLDTLLIGAQWKSDDLPNLRNYFTGDLDEIRTVAAVRSADWLTTEFANQSDPYAFYRILPAQQAVDVELDITGTQITLEAWAKVAGLVSDPPIPGQGILSKSGWNEGLNLVVDVQPAARNISFQLTGSSGYTVNTTGVLSTDPNWHHVVATYDGALMRVYIDGTVDPTTDARTGGIDQAGKEFWIGHGDHAIEQLWSNPWDGELDEVRVSDIARDADWIATQHNNQDSPATFHILSAEELNGAFCGADVTTSTITAYPTSIAADGTTTSTIIVQLKDSFGNDLTVSGGTVTLLADLGSLGGVTDNGDGTYSATLTSAAAPGTATITGELDTVPITDNETVEFIDYTWPDCSYLYRMPLTVTTTTPAVDAGYTVAVTFDHAALVAAVPAKSVASGDDVRVFHWNGTSWDELDRTLDPLSSWNDASTKIWFQLANPIPASSADGNYFLAYGDSTPTAPPDEWANIFRMGDDFNDSAITGSLTVSTAGAGSIAETAGEAQFDGGAADADGAMLVHNTAIVTDREFTYRHMFNLVSGSTGTGSTPESKGIGIVESAAQPGTSDSTVENPRRRIVSYVRLDGEGALFYYASGGVRTSWDGGAWTTSGTPPWTSGLALDTYYIHAIVSDGTNWYMKVTDATGTTLTTTDPVAWSSMQQDGDPYWFYIGDPYTNFYWNDSNSDWIYERDYVNSEPTSGKGTEETNQTYCAQAADPATSTITASPTSIAADGASTSTITVQLKDGFGNNLTASGGTVTLATNIGSLSGVTDVSDGTYTATLTSSVTPGTATITGTVNTAPIADNATVEFVSTAWAQCDFEYRKMITIDAAQVVQNLVDFPVLIHLDGNGELAANARNDGFDISFTSSDGLTKLSHEIEKFDGATGELVAWVKVPSISSSSDTNIYMYFGNATSGDQQNVADVWSNGYSEVFHLDETSGNHIDSSNGVVATVQGTVDQIANGQIDGADEFLGLATESRLSVADGTLTGDSPFTMEAWFRLETLPGAYVGIVTKGRDGAGVPDWLGLWVDDLNQINFGWDWNDVGNLAGSALSIDTWYHAVAVFDGTDKRLYLDGTINAGPQGPATYGDITEQTRIGDDSNLNYFDGIIDEVRVSSVPRSGGWIASQHNNQLSPESFYSVGTVEAHDSFCSGATADWWDCGYDYRQPLSVDASTAAIPSAYSVSFTFDHAALVLAGKSLSSGDDVRILYWNGSWYDELDRFLDPGSSWDSATTKIWFQTRAGVGASSSDANYALYYGNTSAGAPPADPDSVFWHYDDFETGDVSKWDEVWTGGSAAFNVVSTTVRSGTYAGEAVVGAGDQVAAVLNDHPAVTGLSTTAYYYLPAGWDDTEYVALSHFNRDISPPNRAALTIWGESPPDGDMMKPYIYNVPGGGFYFSDAPITTGAWHRLEMKFLVHPTSGQAELWVDGVQKVNQTGIDTGTDDIVRSFEGIYWRPADASTVYVDDTFDRLWVGAEPTVSPSTEEISTCSQIYWVDNGAAKKISSADLDGTNLQDRITSGLGAPRRLAIDAANGKMYWTDPGNTSISRSDLDGTNIEVLVTGLTTPRGIALDVAGGYMYWVDSGTNKIQRATLEGAFIEDLVTSAGVVRGIALDLIAGKMYWTDDTNNEIRRANLDGTSQETVVTGLNRPEGIELDVANGKVYWVDLLAGKIQRANISGAPSTEDLIVHPTVPLVEGTGIALDLVNDKLYWTDYNFDHIRRANLDGSSPEDIVTTGLDVPTGIEVYIPVGAADPATSTITADPTSVTGDGISISTITVQLRDAQWNLLTAGGDTVALNSTLGSLGSVTDNGDGTYTATLTAPSSTGTATITGTVNAIGFTDDATVDFSAASCFASNGQTILDITNDDYVNSVVIQPDGKIVVGGASYTGTDGDFLIMRYNADGTLDTTFDVDGMTTTDFGTWSNLVGDIALQPDGKIVAVGWSNNGTSREFAVARYNSDGSLDTTFDTDGIAIVDITAANDEANGVVIQPDGKIVVVGHTLNGTTDFAVARFNADGSLDNTFDTDGMLTTDLFGSEDRARDVDIQSDGKIVVIGQEGLTASRDFAVVRYNTDGSLDTSFDTDGKVTTDFYGSTDQGRELVIQPDGKIVVVGRIINGGQEDFGIARYETNGALDTSFDTDGWTSTDINGEDQGEGLDIQPDGKLVAIGYSNRDVNGAFTVVRYNSDGSLDTSFDGDGIATVDLASGLDDGEAVVVQPDGKIVAVGHSMNTDDDVGLVRFNTDGSVDNLGCAGPTSLYRSVGTTATNLNVSSYTVEISGTTATFAGSMPDSIGVGDALTYNNGSNQLAFISGRTSDTVYTVVNKDGGTPVATPALTAVGVYRSYSSLFNWEASTQNGNITEPAPGDVNPATDLVGANTIMMVAVYGDGEDTSSVYIDSWDTGANNYIQIYTPTATSEVGASQRHDGKWDTNSAYRISNTAATDYVIHVRERYVRIDGLQIDMKNAPSGTGELFGIQVKDGNGSSPAEIHVSNSIVRQSYGTPTTVKSEGIAPLDIFAGADSDFVARVWNNLVYGLSSTAMVKGIEVDNNATAYIFNNTVVGDGGTATTSMGIDGGTNLVYAKNNISIDWSNPYNQVVSGAGTNNNVSDTGDAPGAAPQNCEPTFTNKAGNDYHLAASDTCATDNGADLSADPNLAFTDDIDLQTRSGSWDIGVDEYSATSTTSLYRSVGTTATDLNLLTRTVQISGTSATFSGAMPNNVGVGDVLAYSSGGNQLAFITGRTSDTVYTVEDKNGGTPASAPALTAVSVYRAYTSLANWQSSAENPNITEPTENDVNPGTDLVSADTVMMVAAYGDGEDTTGLYLNSWVTGPSNYVKIYTPTSTSEVGASQRHNGTWDTSAYRVSMDGTRIAAITIRERYVRIDGLQVDSNLEFSGESNGIHVSDDNADAPIEIQISNSIFRMTAASPAAQAFGIGTLNNFIGSNSDYIVKVWNNTVYGYTAAGGTAGVCIYASDNGTVYAYNNTCVGGSGANRGIATFNSVDFYAKNNIAIDATDPYFAAVAFNAASTNNFSDLGDAPGLLPKTRDGIGGDPVFVGGSDYHLNPTDTWAQDQGADLSGDANLPFSDDIDLETRSGSWDIGADEETASPLAYWNFNEGTGQTVTDVTGNGYDGTLGATAAVAGDDPAWTCVTGGYALNFDGTNDEVRISSPVIADLAAWTITAWIKMDPDSLDQRAIYSEGDTAAPGYLFVYVDDVGTETRFYSTDPSFVDAQVIGTTNVEDSQWHLVTMVQRSKTDRELYVGTNSEGTDTQDAGTLSPNTASIGAWVSETYFEDPFKGMIDDVRIYDRELSPAEISALAASPPTDCGATVNYRSIGTDITTLYSTGDASINSGTTTVTFAGGANLPVPTAVGAIGQGDKLVIGGETFFILSRTDATHVEVQTAATSTHTSAAYAITRAYNDIASWESGQQGTGDLVGENRIEVGVAYKDGVFTPTAAITINGSENTDATHYMSLTVAPGQRHNGTAGTGVVVDGSGFATDHLFFVRDKYFRMEWLEIRNFFRSITPGQPIIVNETNAGNNLFSHLIIHDYTSNDGTASRGAINVYETATIRNSIIYNGDVGIRTYSSEAVLVPTLTLENVTIFGMTNDGVRHRAGTAIIKNTISVGSGAQDFDLDPANSSNGAPVTVDGSSGYNLYSTVDAGVHPGTNNQVPPASLEDLFVSIVASSEDLHLETSGNAAIDNGTTIGTFSDDIDEEGRPQGSAWDIGADEAVGAGAFAYFTFDEGSGQTAADSSGNSRNGTLGSTTSVESNDPTWGCVTGGNALEFDGGDQVLVGEYDLLSAISISAWINWDAVTTDDGILSKRTSTEVLGNWALRMDGTSATGLLEWMVWTGDAASQKFYSTTAIGTGVWTHVVLTFDETTNTAKFYINGTLDNTTTTFTNNLEDTAQSIIIGWAGQSSQYFDGRIDEVRIFDYALNQSEVDALASPAVTDCAAAWYNGSWAYRKAITIQSSQVDSNLSDFPVYVDMADLGADFFSNVNGDGGDIRITTSDGQTEMAREIVDINTGGQTGELHFEADSLSSSSDTVFYIYYGNGGASDYAVTDTYGRNAVWSNAYDAVWHLEEEVAGIGNANLYVDSTGNGNDGDDEVTATGQTGRLGNGQELDGAADYINMGDVLDKADPADFTLESWIQPTIPAASLAVSGTSSFTNYYQVPSVTFQHTTPTGANRLLLVGVSLNPRLLNETVDTITYDGVPLTIVGSVVWDNDARVEIWALVAPNEGTNLDVVVTFDTSPGNISEGGVVGATTFTGAEQVLPNPADFVSAIGDPSPATVDVTSTTGELVFAVVANEYNTVTPVSMTEQWNDVNTSSIGEANGAGATKAGTTTTTMQWTLGAGSHWAIGAIPIRPAAAGLSDQMSFITKWTGSGSDRNYRFEVETDGTLTFLPGGGVDPGLNSTTVMSTDTWYHTAVSVRQSSNSIRLYLDGTQEDVNSTWTGAIGNGTGSFNLGRRSDVSQWFDGNLDEVRVSSTNRPAAWLSTQYNNQDSPATFYTVGSQEP
jgi:uncharacterized delta-60 repeat protein